MGMWELELRASRVSIEGIGLEGGLWKVRCY